MPHKRKIKYLIPFVLLVSCTQPEENENELVFYGLDDIAIFNLRIFGSEAYACAGAHGLWEKSIDDDGVWRLLGLTDTSLGNFSNRGVVDVIRNNDNDDHLIVAFQPGQAIAQKVFKSVDGGSTWAAAVSGLEVYIGADKYYSGISQLFYGPDGALFGAGSGGVYRTLDFGESWVRIDSSLGAAIVQAVSTRDPGEQIWLGGDGFFFEPTLSLSLDGGHTWLNKNASIPGQYRFDNAVFSIANVTDGATHFGLHHSIILSTNDMGASWNSVIIDSLVSGPVDALLSIERTSELIASTISYVYVADSDNLDKWEIVFDSNDFGGAARIYNIREILGSNKILIATSSGVYLWNHIRRVM